MKILRDTQNRSLNFVLLKSINIIFRRPNYTGRLRFPIISFPEHNSNCSNIRNHGMLIIGCKLYLRLYWQRRGCTRRMQRICSGALWIYTLWNGTDLRQLLTDRVPHIWPPTLPLFPAGLPNPRADASPRSLRRNSFRSWCCPGPGSAPAVPERHKKPPRRLAEMYVLPQKHFLFLAKIRPFNSIPKRLLFNSHRIDVCTENQGLRENSELSHRPSPFNCY